MKPFNSEHHYIGIRFPDNDFHSTLIPFLEQLWAGFFDRRSQDLYTKQEIITLFNVAAPGIYWLRQNRLEYRCDNPKDFESIDKYLKITNKNVYLDEEIWTYAQKCMTITDDPTPWDNSEFHYIDLYDGQVYTF